jgi:RNA polymerase sigma-70 factor (ECF subfamily)
VFAAPRKFAQKHDTNMTSTLRLMLQLRIGSDCDEWVPAQGSYENCSAQRTESVREKVGQLTLPQEGEAVMGTSCVIDNSTTCVVVQDSAYDDMTLVHACKDGDAGAFEQLVKRYDGRLFRIAQHITHNREDAQDAVQEAFLKVFRKLSQFRENSQFSTWLIRITVNESLTRLRKQRAVGEFSIDEDFQRKEHAAPFEFTDWAPDPEELYGGSELREILRSELQELQPALMVVFVLRDVEGLSTEQTAEVLQLTPVAVRARLWRARLRLRERLSKYFSVKRTYHGASISATERRQQAEGSREGFPLAETTTEFRKNDCRH